MSNKTLPKWILIAFVLISFVGFLDASYLTANHYGQVELSCSITSGCEAVTTSEYSKIFGVPVALGGILYYLSILLLSLLYLDHKTKFFKKLVPPLTVVGFLFSAYFVYLQLFVIGAICQYCVLSAINATLLLALSGFVKCKPRHRN
jgi:uncharacterized membrane protein